MSSDANKFYFTAAWKRTRKQVLERDSYVCQIQGPGCKHRATQADHIIPISRGGAKLDLANLRAACTTCNAGRANRARSVGWLNAPTRIHLVMGPPGAGKTVYVQEHAAPEDLVVDWDALAEATRPGESRTGTPEQSPTPAKTGHGEATRLARNALLRGLRRGEIPVPHAWIISTNPQAETIFPHHDTIVLDPGPEVCHTRRPMLPDVIESWYQNPPGRPSPHSRNWH